ncbi:MAG: FAD-dependent oxidoreductase [Microthrixaceae bacterium]
MARIVVIGAGVGGLGVGLACGRQGHEVVLVERDDTPLPQDADGAFDWDRRGAPQVRHSHAFLARLRNLLLERHPDVLDALLDAGATPLDFIAMLPEGMDRTPMPGDDELVALACRRTTFEWVLRRVVTGLDGEHTPLVELRHGHGVTSLVTTGSGDGVPQVVGVELDDGTRIDADVVVDASGRRSPLPALLAQRGVELPEHDEDTGIIYFSRFFRLLDGAEYPPQLGPIGGDLEYLKFGVFQGDNRTFSITLAARVHDDELRRRLLDPDTFLEVAAQIPATERHVEADRAEPITGVHVMARLLNRRRHFTDEHDRPRVLGLHAVGDAHTCTNPLYGRGCSLAMVQAHLLADALDAHGLDHAARAAAYEAATATEITPWYRAAVSQDRMGRRARDAEARTSDGPGAESQGDESPGNGSASPNDETASGDDPEQFVRQLLTDGLFPALRVDPVVLRAFLRMLNLLRPPDSLMADGAVISRVMAVYAERDQRPPPPPIGPSRDALLATLDA